MQSTLVNLQALRGIACLLVVALHVGEWESLLGLGFNPARPFRFFGHYGVDLFFVLSGFILTYSHAFRPGARFTLGSYVVSRFRRIYPTYWAVLAVGIGVCVVMWKGDTFGPGWEKLLLEMVLLLPTDSMPVWLPVSWTLVYEIMFYLVLGLLLVLPRRAAYGLAALWAAAIIARSATNWTPPTLMLGHFLNPLVLEFLAGAVVAYCVDRGRGYPLLAAVVAVAWWSVAFFAFFDPKNTYAGVQDQRVRVLIAAVPAALIVYAAVKWDEVGRTAPRWMAWFGDRSYSIYLMHTIVNPVIMFGSIELGVSHTRVPHVLWLGAMFWSGVGAGVLLYWLVESRVMAWGKRAKVKVVEPAVEPISESQRLAA